MCIQSLPGWCEEVLRLLRDSGYLDETLRSWGLTETDIAAVYASIEEPPRMLSRLDARLRRLEQQRQETDLPGTSALACWPTPAPITVKQSPSQTSLMPSWTRR